MRFRSIHGSFIVVECARSLCFAWVYSVVAISLLMRRFGEIEWATNTQRHAVLTFS